MFAGRTGGIDDAATEDAASDDAATEDVKARVEGTVEAATELAETDAVGSTMGTAEVVAAWDCKIDGAEGVVVSAMTIGAFCEAVGAVAEPKQRGGTTTEPEGDTVRLVTLVAPACAQARAGETERPEFTRTPGATTTLLPRLLAVPVCVGLAIRPGPLEIDTPPVVKALAACAAKLPNCAGGNCTCGSACGN
jgi:hypothetical protein